MEPSKTRGMGVFILLVAMIPLVILNCSDEEEKSEVVPTVEPSQPQATWSIRGKVLFDPDLHKSPPMVGDFPRAINGRTLPGWDWIEEDGSFAFEGVPEGTFTLKVGDMDRPPLHEQAIELGSEGGERLIPEIDLRANTRRIQIKVLDEDGLQPNFVVVKNLDGDFVG